MFRLLLVHSVSLVSALMMATIQKQPDMTVIGCVDTKQDALTKLRHSFCDLILIDLHLPDGEADSLLADVIQRHAPPKVLMTDLPDDEPTILHYLEAGATGYLLTSDTLDEFVNKIRAVGQHEFHLPPAITAKLIVRLAELKRLTLAVNGDKPFDTDPKSELTSREQEVLDLIGQGLTNAQIAQRLTIELGTVKNHVHNILDKLDLDNRQQAALYAQQRLW